MKIESLVNLVKDEPLFNSALLEVAGVNRASLRAQLARWVKTGHLIQLRRRLYVLARKYRRIEPHPFLIANRLHPPSYVSFESALGYHGLIPEHVPSVTSVTTGRPCTYNNPFGRFLYRHLRKSLFSGYQRREASAGQIVLMARPEKALIDLLYITPRSDAEGYVEELRLQNLETLDPDSLTSLAEGTGSVKVRRAVRKVCSLAENTV